MNISDAPDRELEQRLSARLLDVLIRAGLVLALTMLCYKIFSPFFAPDVMGSDPGCDHVSDPSPDRQEVEGQKRTAATLLVLVCMVMIVAPTSVLFISLGDSTYSLLNNIKDNTVGFPNLRRW